MKNRLILFKTFTNVEHGENNEINRNVLTIALWEFCWLKGCQVTMATVKRTLKMK